MEPNIDYSLSESGVLGSLFVDKTPYDLRTPIYPVIFESHSFSDPVCKHLNDTTNIAKEHLDVNDYNRTASFIKRFGTDTSDSISTTHSICSSYNKLTWNISVDDTNSKFSKHVGLVIPVQSDLYYSGSIISRSICQYMPDRRYKDQMVLRSPEVTFRWNERIVKVTAIADGSVTFFIHSQNEQRCLRVSTPSTSISVTIDFNSHNTTVLSENPKTELILDHLNASLQNIQTNQDVTHILDLCRTLRHSGVCWEIDYIKPNQYMPRALELIKRAESLLFVPESALVKDGYLADINQVVAFQNIRAHLLASENNMQSAKRLLSNTMKHHYDNIDSCRKSNLLFSLCAAHLCSAEFEASHSYYMEMWHLLRYADIDTRYNNGLMDNWVVINIVYWYFMYFVKELKDFIAKKLKSTPEDIYRHKQKYFVSLCQDNPIPIVSQIGSDFYRIACEKMPTLPQLVI